MKWTNDKRREAGFRVDLVSQQHAGMYEVFVSAEAEVS